MNYRIIITKTEPNPKFAEQVEEWNSRNKYGMGRFDEQGPQRDVARDVLVTELSEEQYKKVKAEVLKVFE